MFVIHCPWCGARPLSEFRGHGEAHIRRPADPQAVSDADWAAYLFERANPKGLILERWLHHHGCRRWFNIARNTATDEIFASYPANAAPPDLPAGAGRATQLEAAPPPSGSPSGSPPAPLAGSPSGSGPEEMP